MGKNKLARWTEFGAYANVIQPEIGDVFANDHPIKGKWNSEMFRNENPVVLELGCGKGEYTIGMATRFPDKNFIGIDIKGARMWRGAKTANEQKLTNVAFLRTRIEFIGSFFSVDEVDEIWITFPDPHPGGRNSGKRLTSPRFLNVYRSFLKDNGLIHLKTDNTELYRFTKNVASHNNLEIIIATDDLYKGISAAETNSLLSKAASEPVTVNPENSSVQKTVSEDILSIRTHYEKIFLKAGMKITYLSFIMKKEKTIEDASQKTKAE